MFGRVDELYQPLRRHVHSELHDPSSRGKASVRWGPDFCSQIKDSDEREYAIKTMLLVQETSEALDVCFPISIRIKATKLVSVRAIKSIM